MIEATTDTEQRAEAEHLTTSIDDRDGMVAGAMVVACAETRLWFNVENGSTPFCKQPMDMTLSLEDRWAGADV